MLNTERMAPIKNGAPGNCTGAEGEVNMVNKLVISKGPTIDVKLIKLVKAP